MVPASDGNLVGRVAELKNVVARLRAELAGNDGAFICLHFGSGLSAGQVLGLPVSQAAICRAPARSACTDLVARANKAPALTTEGSGWRAGGDGE